MKANFNCSQADLILVVTTGLNSFLNYVAQFTLYNKLLTALWEQTMRTDLATAEAMPDEYARDAASSAKAVKVMGKATVAREMWQQLKDFISNAFPENLVDIMLNAAGWKLYKSAGQDNWAQILQMLASATRFLNTNLQALEDAGEMPTNFPTDFAAAITAFKQELLEYEDLKTDNMVIGQERLAALNDIHKRFMTMMTAGQKNFKDNPAVRTQFVFVDVLARVGGHGLAGAEGKVIDNVSSLPISNVAVKLVLNDNPEMEYNTTTNDDGDFTLNCPSGTYTMTFIATGYVTKTLENVVIEVGTMKRVNEKLSAV